MASSAPAPARAGRTRLWIGLVLLVGLPLALRLLPIAHGLPRNYVPDMRAKIDLYRRLAQLTTEAAVDDFANELADRFGPLPAVVAHLLELARLRIWAHRSGVREIRIEDRYVVFGYSARDKLNRLVTRSGGRLRVADAASAYLPLPNGDDSVAFDEVKSLLRPDSKTA